MKNSFAEKIGWLWENAEKLPVILFFATFTLNIRKIFLTPHSYLNGEFNEYLTISISWADLLMLSTIIIYTIKYILKQPFCQLFYHSIYGNKFCFLSIRKPYSNVSRETFVLFIFIFWIVLSILWSQDKFVSVYQLAAILEILIFFVIALQILKNQKWFRLAMIALIFNGLVQSLIGICQFIQNKSLGLHFIGESILAADVSGVAKFIVEGERHIRAYGTLPHPNILAGFLLVPLFLLINIIVNTQKMNVPRETEKEILQTHAWSIRSFFQSSKIFRDREKSISPDHTPAERFFIKKRGVSYFVILITLFIVSFGFLLTISRSAFLGLAASLAFYLLTKLLLNFKKGTMKITFKTVFFTITAIILILSLLLPILRNHTSFFSGQSIKERVFYQEVSRETISKHSLRGIGINQFVLFEFNRFPNMEGWRYQPVHNIYLLILAELGLVGLALFLLFLFLLLFSKETKDGRGGILLTYSFIYCIIISLLVVSVFDHYIWDIKLGMIIFAISAVLLYREKSFVRG